jgi:hypothetical protein
MTVRIPGTDICTEAAMDNDLKHRLAAMPYANHLKPWQAEMKRLEEQAIEAARAEAKRVGLRADDVKSRRKPR